MSTKKQAPALKGNRRMGLAIAAAGVFCFAWPFKWIVGQMDKPQIEARKAKRPGNSYRDQFHGSSYVDPDYNPDDARPAPSTSPVAPASSAKSS